MVPDFFFISALVHTGHRVKFSINSNRLINMHILIYSVSKSNFSAYSWLCGAAKAMKTSCASPSYTLMEEHTFLDTETTNQVTASQDHSLYAMTRREKKYCSLRRRDSQTLASLTCLPKASEPAKDRSWQSHAYILAVPFLSWLFTPPPG